MGSMLKLLGTFFIAGLAILSINRFTGFLSQSSHEWLLSTINTVNVNSLTKNMEFDFNRMGLYVTYQDKALVEAQPQRITFYSDYDEDGTVDRIRYYLSDSTTATQTDNPNDRILYREINSETNPSAFGGVTNFNIRYFDWYGDETTVLSEIKTFEITLSIQSIYGYDEWFADNFWQARFSPPNLRRY
jgi:hypothetical protein